MQIGSNNAFAEELVKVPALFTHYQHHARDHHDVTGFLDFMHKHYAGAHGAGNEAGARHGEQDSDCNLPFRHCGDCGVSFHQSFAGCPSCFGTAFAHNDSAVQYSTEDEEILSQELCDIWQPPKVA